MNPALGDVTTDDLVVLLGEFDQYLQGGRKPTATNDYVRLFGERGWRSAMASDRFDAICELENRHALPEPWATEMRLARQAVAQVAGS